MGCNQGGEGEAEPESQPQGNGCERRDRKEGQERPARVTCAVNAFLPRPSSSDSLSDPRGKHAINTQLTKIPRGPSAPDLPEGRGTGKRHRALAPCHLCPLTRW